MGLKLLDLFSGAGGAGFGYHQAGYEVTGVDILPQKHYPLPFVQADAIQYLRDHWHEYDVIHASPPCQAHSAMKNMHNAKEHEDLIALTRTLLIRTGKPYVIENVVGAPLINPVLLCGTMFGLAINGAELQRHRLFESNRYIPQPECKHGGQPSVIGIYGGHARNRKRTEAGDHRGGKDFSSWQAHEAMRIWWMTMAELSQAIPPAYTHYVGLHVSPMIWKDGKFVSRETHSSGRPDF